MVLITILVYSNISFFLLAHPLMNWPRPVSKLYCCLIDTEPRGSVYIGLQTYKEEKLLRMFCFYVAHRPTDWPTNRPTDQQTFSCIELLLQWKIKLWKFVIFLPLWKQYVNNMTIIWEGCGNNMLRIWQGCGNYMWRMWKQYELETIWPELYITVLGVLFQYFTFQIKTKTNQIVFAISRSKLKQIKWI